VTSLVIEQFATPDTHRKARELELTRRRAADELAGRTVWCITAADRDVRGRGAAAVPARRK
jgi:hypothetical protein